MIPNRTGAGPGVIGVFRDQGLDQGRPEDVLPEIERVRTDILRKWLYAPTYAALGRQKQSDAALKELIAKYGSRGASRVAWTYAFRNQGMKRSSGWTVLMLNAKGMLPTRIWSLC